MAYGDELKLTPSDVWRNMLPASRVLTPKESLIADISAAQNEQTRLDAEKLAQQSQEALTGVPAAKVDRESEIRNALDAYSARAKAALKAQGGEVGRLKDYMEQIKSVPMETNLSPALAFVDSLGSAKLSPTYNQPETMVDRMKTLTGLQQAVAKSTGDLSSGEQDMLKTQLDTLLGLHKVDNSLGALGKDNQAIIIDLAKKNATKAAIANQLDATLQQLNDPRISDEQKIVLGNGLLKTINSKEGVDAIGAEEAARIGSQLQLFNVTGPGKFWSRDIKGFSESVARSSNSIKDAIKANQSIIDNIKAGRGFNLGQTPIVGEEIPEVNF